MGALSNRLNEFAVSICVAAATLTWRETRRVTTIRRTRRPSRFDWCRAFTGKPFARHSSTRLIAGKNSSIAQKNSSLFELKFFFHLHKARKFSTLKRANASTSTRHLLTRALPQQIARHHLKCHPMTLRTTNIFSNNRWELLLVAINSTRDNLNAHVK